MKKLDNLIKMKTNLKLEIINQYYAGYLGLARIVLKAPSDVIFIYFQEDEIKSAYFHSTTFFTAEEIIDCINNFT